MITGKCFCAANYYSSTVRLLYSMNDLKSEKKFFFSFTFRIACNLMHAIISALHCCILIENNGEFDRNHS